MKKIISLFVILVASVSVKAQNVSDVRVALGWRSHFGGAKSFTEVMQFYNDNRPWLNNELGTLPTLNGIELGLEVSTPKIGFSMFHLYWAGSGKTAKGVDQNGVDFKRKVKFRTWGVEMIDAWWTPLHLKNINIGFGAMPFGIGVIRFNTSLNGEKFKPALSDLETVTDNPLLSSYHLYANFHIDFTKILDNESAWHLQFFYTLGPKREYDLFYLNKMLNPNTFESFKERTLLKVNNFGLKLMYNI